ADSSTSVAPRSASAISPTTSSAPYSTPEDSEPNYTVICEEPANVHLQDETRSIADRFVSQAAIERQQTAKTYHSTTSRPHSIPDRYTYRSDRQEPKEYRKPKVQGREVINDSLIIQDYCVEVRNPIRQKPRL